MPALVIRQFGAAADVLEMDSAPMPQVGPGEVRVRILAAPINPADLNWIEGTYGTRPILPATPGTEAVGEVIESNATALPVGTRVIFLSYAHGWQTQRVVRADELLAVPADLPVSDLAMLKVNPATAWRILHDFVALRPGAVVVQNAANSGVGRCVIQIAHALGLRTINMVRQVALADELQACGADLVCGDDEAGKEAALAYLRKQGVRASLALNAVGGESALRQLDLLEEGATQVTYGAMGRRPLTIPNKFLIFRDIRFRGFWLTHWLAQASSAEIAGTYASLLELLRRGRLHQPVDSLHPLPSFREALQRLHAADRKGKILFAPATEK
jgi:trans-2-enoyl-CoA reductase